MCAGSKQQRDSQLFGPKNVVEGIHYPVFLNTSTVLTNERLKVVWKSMVGKGRNKRQTGQLCWARLCVGRCVCVCVSAFAVGGGGSVFIMIK